MTSLYVLIATNLITLALLLAAVASARKDLRAERERASEREDTIYEAKRVREDQLLNRIQAPNQAPVQSMTELAGPVDTPAYISAFDDEALAEFEANRDRVRADVERFIEENTAAGVAE